MSITAQNFYKIVHVGEGGTRAPQVPDPETPYDELYYQNWESAAVKGYSKDEFNAAFQTAADDMKSTGVGCQTTASHGYNSVAVVNTRARAGTKCVRLENRTVNGSTCINDPNKARVEIKYAESSELLGDIENNSLGGAGWGHGTETWLGMSYYFPSGEGQDWIGNDSKRMIIYQIVGVERPSPENPDVSPVLHMMLGADRQVDVEVTWGTGTQEEHTAFGSVFQITLDTWTDIVVRWVKHYDPAQAKTEIYVNGVLKLNVNHAALGIGNCPEKFQGTWFKHGLYRGTAAYDQAPAKRYVMYTDEVRLSRGGNYDTVAPGQ